MRHFSQLLADLDGAKLAKQKESLLELYLKEVTPENAAWTTFLLLGSKIKKPLSISKLKKWVAQFTLVPDWLIAESAKQVGNMAETLHLLLPISEIDVNFDLHEIMQIIVSFDSLNENEKYALLEKWCKIFQTDTRLILFKMLTGSLKCDISRHSVIAAVAGCCQIPVEIIAQKLAENWYPSFSFWIKLTQPIDVPIHFPFTTIKPLFFDDINDIKIENCHFECYPDGFRAQIIIKNQQLYIWGENKQLLTQQFPEFQSWANECIDFVVFEGIICCKGIQTAEKIQNLQKRVEFKTITTKGLSSDSFEFYAIDFLQWNATSLHQISFSKRYMYLQNWVKEHRLAHFNIAQKLVIESRQQLAHALSLAQEKPNNIVSFKSNFSVYTDTNIWWFQLKSTAYTIDSILLYAQKGNAGNFIEYTFAVWSSGNQLVSFAKAFNGLSNNEHAEIAQFIKKNTTEKHGPIRTVKPLLVFTIAFENIYPSKKHKNRFVVLNARIIAWHKNRNPLSAGSLDKLNSLVFNM